jgi:Transcription factor/nuclear export subunit protein 2
VNQDWEERKKDFEETRKWLKVKLNDALEDIPDQHLVNLSTFFVQFCLHPRLMFSAQDALYSFHFLKTLHALRVPKFNFLQILAQILRSVVPSIHMCTVAESDNLGIFFLEFFTLINDWTDDDIWNKNCEGYSGFSRMVGS